MKKTSSTFIASRRRCLGGLALGSVVLSLEACGWHVRGKVELAYKKILLSGNLTPDFRFGLDTALKANNIEQAKSAKEADLVLEIVSEQSGKQVLTYSNSGQINAYRIINRIVFRAFDPDGIEVMPESDIYLTRDVSFVQADVQSFDYRVNQELADMRSEIILQLMRRLANIKKKPAKE
jgi:LPS-assembly lipoprotein